MGQRRDITIPPIEGSDTDERTVPRVDAPSEPAHTTDSPLPNVEAPNEAPSDTPEEAEPQASEQATADSERSPEGAPGIIGNAVEPFIPVMHASVGSGHKSAAGAIVEAFETLRDSQAPAFPDGSPMDPETRIELIDILEWGRIVFDGNKAASSFTGATRPFYDLTWRYGLTGRVLWGGGTGFSRVMYPKFTQYVRDTEPLAIVNTHITAANTAAGARILSGQNFPIVNVPTDYEIEGLWPHRHTDAFCVATEHMAETLRPRRVPEERIIMTGIPTRKDFLESYNRAETRVEFDLPQDKGVVLVMAGATLEQPYAIFRKNIEEALPDISRINDMQAVIVTGNNIEWANHLRDIIAKNHLSNITVLGYVNRMAALMAASDLVICKPGGLTVTECLCAQTPMILLGRAYGQEKSNMNMLTSMGAALHVTTPRELSDALQRLSKDHRRVSAMLTNANSLRMPNAAEAIAKKTLELVSMRDRVTYSHNTRHAPNIFIGGRPAHVR